MTATNKLLEDITIIDFSHRLPGPYGSYLLAKLGANVIKIEDEKFKDPFLTEFVDSMDDSFLSWYQNLNHEKKIMRLNFSSSTIKEELKAIVEPAQAMICALPPKAEEKIGLQDLLKNTKKPMVVIRPVASLEEEKPPMHDLNALAETDLLRLHVQEREDAYLPPPFLPFAGLAFGNAMALQLLAGYHKALKDQKSHTLYSGLFESTEMMFSPFWKGELKKSPHFLHNGKYPCYGIYRTKDGAHIAMAAVEKKFWDKFCELFNLGELNAFNGVESRAKLIDLFSNLTSEQIKSTIGNHNICVTVF